MRDFFRKAGLSLVLAFAIVTLSYGFVAKAESQIYTVNDTTGYEAFVCDDEGLLTDVEREQLLSQLEGLTSYGNMFFYTTYAQTSDYELWAEGTYEYLYGEQNGVIFQIDMNNRKLTILAYNALKKDIDDGICKSITDNVFRLASNEDYYGCAKKAFDQIGKVLAGESIAQPMKYVCAALLAIVAGIFINYLILRATSSSKASSTRSIIDNMKGKREAVDYANARFIRETRRRRPKDNGSSGHGGGGHSGGGHSSGSHGF